MSTSAKRIIIKGAIANKPTRRNKSKYSSPIFNVSKKMVKALGQKFKHRSNAEEKTLASNYFNGVKPEKKLQRSKIASKEKNQIKRARESKGLEKFQKKRRR